MGSTSHSGRTMKNLTVRTQQYADRTVITAAGDIDFHTCPTLHQAVLAVPPGGTAQIDLSGVTFMDSSGLNLLLQLRKRLLAEGGGILVTSLQPAVEYMLRLTETYALLAADPDGKAA